MYTGPDLFSVTPFIYVLTEYAYVETVHKFYLSKLP